MKKLIKRLKKKKGMKKVILEQPGKMGHVQRCLPLPLDTSLTEVAAALASHCCSSTIGFDHLIPSDAAKHRTIPARSSLSALLPASSSPVAFDPWFIFLQGSSTPWPSPGLCSGLSPTTWEVWDTGANNKQHRNSARGCLLAGVFNSWFT